MDTFRAMENSNRAIAEGARSRVFDWNKAAALIRERKPAKAAAGLRDDWEWTGGTIYEHAAPVNASYTFLSSTWAVPELELDGERVACWRYEDETGWDAKTKWPPSALRILTAEHAP